MQQMFLSGRRSVKRWTTIVAVAAAIATIAGLARPAPASAHCDSTTGPVVSGAREALDSGDVARVLVYVKPEAEAELSAAFRQTLEVRQAGGAAQDLADRYFYETAVRLHRQGEGAAYTGLKELSDVGPALTAADRALETGDVGAVQAVIDRTVRTELEERYHAVVEARERAAHEGTLAAAREQAEAELAFETYVDKLYEAALGQAVHNQAAHNEAAHDQEAAAQPGAH